MPNVLNIAAAVRVLVAGVTATLHMYGLAAAQSQIVGSRTMIPLLIHVGRSACALIKLLCPLTLEYIATTRTSLLTVGTTIAPHITVA